MLDLFKTNGTSPPSLALLRSCCAPLLPALGDRVASCLTALLGRQLRLSCSTALLCDPRPLTRRQRLGASLPTGGCHLADVLLHLGMPLSASHRSRSSTAGGGDVKVPALASHPTPFDLSGKIEFRA